MDILNLRQSFLNIALFFRCMVNRIFFDGNFKKKITLSKEESRHLKALRLNKDQAVELFDGKGKVCLAKIDCCGKEAVLEIVKTSVFSPEKKEVILLTAIPKGERSDWLVEKAVELGVTKIIPVNFRYSVVKPKRTKLERWKRLSIAACAQSKRAFVPEISSPVNFKDIFKKYDSFVVCHQDGESFDKLKLTDSIVLVVGPEGGFSEEELEMLKTKSQFLKLNKNVLRTETAGVFGVGLFRSV